jgi:hypothetical protein
MGVQNQTRRKWGGGTLQGQISGKRFYPNLRGGLHRSQSLHLFVVLALATLEDMEIHQMDVKIAFLNGELEKEIYMEQLQGFVHQGGEHLVCKLHKSLFGLKQFPRAWNQKLDAFLKSIEFMKSEADPSVYFARVGDVKFFIVVYADDLILVCNDQTKLLQIKEELNQKFEMKDLGELHFFLGMEVERNCDE